MLSPCSGQVRRKLRASCAGWPKSASEEAKRIGRLIQQLRAAEGWSQEELARRAKISVSTVSRYERGKTKTGGEPKNMRKLADVFDIKPALLLPVEPELVTPLERIETAVRAIDARLGSIESALSAQGIALDGLVKAAEAQAAARSAAAARRAQLKAPGTPRGADRHGRG